MTWMAARPYARRPQAVRRCNCTQTPTGCRIRRQGFATAAACVAGRAPVKALLLAPQAQPTATTSIPLTVDPSLQVAPRHLIPESVIPESVELAAASAMDAVAAVALCFLRSVLTGVRVTAQGLVATPLLQGIAREEV
jgi:hypothetical protein